MAAQLRNLRKDPGKVVEQQIVATSSRPTDGQVATDSRFLKQKRAFAEVVKAPGEYWGPDYDAGHRLHAKTTEVEKDSEELLKLFEHDADHKLKFCIKHFGLPKVADATRWESPTRRVYGKRTLKRVTQRVLPREEVRVSEIYVSK